jgi:hypothetical protein
MADPILVDAIRAPRGRGGTHGGQAALASVDPTRRVPRVLEAHRCLPKRLDPSGVDERVVGDASRLTASAAKWRPCLTNANASAAGRGGASQPRAPQGAWGSPR